MIMRSVVARGILRGMFYGIFRGILCLALLLALRVYSFAQTPESALETPQKSSKTAPPNTIFAEILGNGGLYSLNYERRLLPELNVRIGASYYGEFIDLGGTSSAGASALVLPVLASYLFRFSETPSYLEIGAGVSSAILSVRSSTVEPSSATVYAPYPTFALMYRYMPDDSGLSVRVGVTPLLLPNLFLPWLGVSLGWTFGD